ncbi:MAG: tryptophan synthase subunit alpha [Candidatus Omnitrophica bacterium]|nr:tryptophan synthase subunit alpha [Candidatus Omnitrophota bacterium]
MNRIDKKFLELRRKNEKALIVYLAAGDPSLAKTGELVLALEKEGVDLIELGVPFSDPLADGPVIQEASGRALKKHTTLKKILACVAALRKKTQIPILLMSYLNPLLRYGLPALARDAKKSGVDGFIVPDLPPEEGRQVASLMRGRGVHEVFLLAPTSPPKRIRLAARASRGFIYYVSLTGVTGIRRKLSAEIGRKLKGIRRESRLPVCVGFGISTPDQARKVASVSDGVIVGSAVVKALAAHPSMGAAEFSRRFVRPLVRAGKGEGR